MRYLLCLCFIAPIFAFGATVTGKISGDNLELFSGKFQGDYLVSKQFDRIGGLPKTLEWVPGTFISSTAKTLTLTSEENETVSVPAVLAGSVYLVNGGFTSNSVPSVAPICSHSTVSSQSTVIDDSGSFCVANKSVKFDSSKTPFIQYKPILKLDKAALIKAFDGKPTGTYSGVIAGTLRYAFFANITENVLTYRNIPVTFSVQLRHIGSYISTVSVTGTGIMQPEYNTFLHTAKGQTSFKVIAMGAFESGLKFRFANKDGADYSLKSNNTMLNANEIPYSISCPQCKPNTLLVEDGNIREPDSWIRVERIGRNITFDLDVSYVDVKAEDVVDGEIYRDSFVLMLEVIL